MAMNYSLVINDTEWAAVGVATTAFNTEQLRLDPTWIAIDPTAFLTLQIQTRLLDRWAREQQDADQTQIISTIFDDPQILSQVRQLVAGKQPPIRLISKNVP